MTEPLRIVKTRKFGLFGAGVPSMIAPPADRIDPPAGSLLAMSAAEIAILAPSATRVPSMSRMSVNVNTDVPGFTADVTRTVAGVAATFAEWATDVRSSGATSVTLATNRVPSVKVAVAVYVPFGTMKPAFAANSVSVAPLVIGKATVPFGLFNSVAPASAATPSAPPMLTRVLRTIAAVTRSIYESMRVTPSPIDRFIVKTASSAPSGAIAPEAVPTRSVSSPWYCSDVLPTAGGSDGTRRTATSVAALWFPTESVATIDSRSSTKAEMLAENEPLLDAVANAIAPLLRSVSFTAALASTAPADA